MTAKALAEILQCIEDMNETFKGYNNHVGYDINVIKSLLKDVTCDDKEFISHLEEDIKGLTFCCQGFSDRMKHLIMKAAKEEN